MTTTPRAHELIATANQWTRSRRPRLRPLLLTIDPHGSRHRLLSQARGRRRRRDQIPRAGQKIAPAAIAAWQAAVLIEPDLLQLPDRKIGEPDRNVVGRAEANHA